MHKEVQKLLKISKSLKVLYVEDNEDARSSTIKLLNRFFDDVTVGIDGQDGLEKFKKTKNLDLIITDISMPKMDGIDMIKSIRAINQNINILILSANNEANYFLDAIKLDIDGYLIKPLHMQQLVKQLTKTVGKITLLKEKQEYKKGLELKLEERTQALKYYFYHDGLTKLKNRNALLEDLNNQSFLNLLILDINNFQDYNDIYSLRSSNEIIKSFGKLLKSTINNKTYDLYHFQDNQFILRGKDKSYNIDNFEENLKSLINTISSYKINLNDQKESIQIDATMGVSYEKDLAIEKAIMALRYAKKHKKSHMIYSHMIDGSQTSKKIIA